MPRIAQLSLDQINRQLDTLDSVQKQLAAVQKQLANVGQQIVVTDPIHAVQTTNNLSFTWTGGTLTLSWLAGYIKDKNWSAQAISNPPFVSSAPGRVHFFAVPAGSLVLSASTYYWLGWDPDHQTMRATQDASTLHGDKDIQIICQLFTGTAGQTGPAGGGGSTGGVDLSGARYKNF